VFKVVADSIAELLRQLVAIVEWRNRLAVKIVESDEAVDERVDRFLFKFSRIAVSDVVLLEEDLALLVNSRLWLQQRVEELDRFVLQMSRVVQKVLEDHDFVL
jgi:hypothetical protein